MIFDTYIKMKMWIKFIDKNPISLLAIDFNLHFIP